MLKMGDDNASDRQMTKKTRGCRQKQPDHYDHRSGARGQRNCSFLLV